ncbi:MAG: adenylate kinase [Bacteroidales bacterium]|nr:adenylate kinase [Bacteroidales bacterium]
MKHFIMFGPPGAGKGTQAAMLVDKFNLRHVSTGDLLRGEIKRETELGLKAKKLIEAGSLVPDEVVEGMIKNEIASHPEVKGFIFDGFPRTLEQAAALDGILAERGEEISGVISIIIDDEMVKARIRHRAEIEDRKDDMDEATVANRIKTYHDKTEPIIDYYKKAGKYNGIDGVGSIDDIFNRICGIIEKL